MALGLRMRDLFDTTASAPTRTVLATYDYVDRDGVLEAQKVRYSDKSFKWRRPADGPDAWHWNLGDVCVGLYRLPELRGAQRVFVTEGEKAVDRLWSLKLPATCPPSGASRWEALWSQQLLEIASREIIVLADNDRPGDEHAERVAAGVTQQAGAGLIPLGAKVIRFGGLQRGQDVHDWFDNGHTAEDLLQLVDASADWCPEARELARVQRKRARTLERVRRFRDRQKMILAAQPHDTTGVASPL